MSRAASFSYVGVGIAVGVAQALTPHGEEWTSRERER